MRVVDDRGVALDASFSIEPTPTGVEMVVESRGGTRGGAGTRNVQYGPGLELLLRRLAVARVVLTDAWVDSAIARRLPIAERRLLLASEFPLELAAVGDVRALRHRIGKASAAVGREPGATGGGNPTKRLRLILHWPGAVGRTGEELEAELGSPGPSSPQADWSEPELRGCVLAYKVLWDGQAQGGTLSKANLRREVLARDLPTRSHGSYEFRMQNISAVLVELGLEWVDGYAPRGNIGSQKSTIIDLINEIWARQTTPELITADPEALMTRVASARSKLREGRKWSSPPAGRSAPPRQAVEAFRFPRDPEVIAWVLEGAGGHCEVCRDPAPFLRNDGEPFLEVHHVRPLAEGGPDTTDNAVACCPNCHRKLHYGADGFSLRRKLIGSVPRLKDHPKVVGSPSLYPA